MNDHVFDTTAWSKMDVFHQMGNIGSEVGRALNAKKQGKFDRMNSAFKRGLDLIDITANFWALQKTPRLRELLIARELFARSIMTDEVDPTLESYFMQFALAARLQK